MRHLAAVLLVAFAACSQRVYAPPSQLFAVTPITALPQNRQALELEASHHAQIFDPAIEAGAARLRFGIGNDTEASLEGSTAVVRDDGPSPEPRTFYTGRAGLRSNPGHGAFTMFAGAGGGFGAAGGTFISADAGFAVGHVNCVLVPQAQASAYVSEPLDARPIDVTTDPDAPTFDTPHTTIGAVVRAGLRLSLSPSACRRGEQSPWLYAGLGVTRMMDADSDAAIPGIGIGLEIPLSN